MIEFKMLEKSMKICFLKSKKEKELNEHLENELKLIKKKEEIENNRKIAILKDGIEEKKELMSKKKNFEAIKILKMLVDLQKWSKELMLKKKLKRIKSWNCFNFRKNIN